MTPDSPTLQNPAHELAVLQAVVDGMAEGVWITAEDGTVLRHNSALKELLYTGHELIGRLPKAILDNEELETAVQKACHEGASTRLEVAHEGLRPRVLSIHVAPLGRDLKGSTAVFIDVTELRHLEKVRKDFVANVSHELRTPITAIRGYAETLRSGALNDPAVAPKMVEIIHRQAERLSELVDDLLELSRLDSKQIKLAAEPIELDEVVLRAIEAARPKARARGTVLEVSVPDGLAAVGDARAIEQVVLNLVDNAIKYAQAQGHVWIVAKALDDASVELSVRDDGPGIDAKHLPRLFERFYRVDKGRSRDMGGTGLGLSIVKNLVTAMRGEVRVDSAPGKGSTFAVELPRATAAAAANPSAPRSQGV